MLVYKYKTVLNRKTDKPDNVAPLMEKFNSCLAAAKDVCAPVFDVVTRIAYKSAKTSPEGGPADTTYSIALFCGFYGQNTDCEKFAGELEKQLNSAFSADELTFNSQESCLFEMFYELSKTKGSRKKELFDKFARFRPSDNCEQSTTFIEEEKLTLRTALKKARELCADKSLLDEIRRIFHKDNLKEFVGHPVHYRLSVSSFGAAQEIQELLLKCLLANNRLPSKRVDTFSDFTQEAAMDYKLPMSLRCSEFATLVILPIYAGELSLHTKEASAVKEVIARELEYIGDKTLIILVDVEGSDNFADELVENVSDSLSFIDIKEGRLTNAVAKAWLEKTARNSVYYNYPGADQLLPKLENKEYTSYELQEKLNVWSLEVLQTSVYKSYKGVGTKTISKIKARAETTVKAYDQLMGLVGLQQVKKIVKQLIATHRVNQLRENSGLKSNRQSLHMIFSGNPGSAKTTVARLLAKIMYEEGITSSDKLVECSRADLIGKHVGWTANMVTERFQEAKGGVLFIDEAYSLIGEGNDFGREAISTLVQLMENNRDKVIVIFAGYPEKMRQFLEQNEGLKSRIAFHLDFPDYSVTEMNAILEQLAIKKDYVLDEAAKEKCSHILKQAVSGENFGNGRFARNMVEQAIMNQALRLSEKADGKRLRKDQLRSLLAEDFEMPFDTDVCKCRPMGIIL